MSIGEKVRELRQALNLTQREFAAKIPVSENRRYGASYIGKIERGDQRVSIKYLNNIARAFDKPLVYFFEEKRRKASKKIDLKNSKVRALACLLSYYNWEFGHFRKCRTCEQELLCKTVKALVNSHDLAEKE